MTYKSIRDAIAAHEGTNLFCLPPWLGGEETPRTIFVSRDVLDIVTPPWPETREGRRYSRLRGLLDDFTEGGLVTIAENPFAKDATAILARVSPIKDELWDFRCLDPRPGIRAFGGFSEQDTFVILTWDFRENLDGGDFWNEAVSQCKAKWKDLFGALPPFTGKQIHEYVSYNYRAV